MGQLAKGRRIGSDQSYAEADEDGRRNPSEPARGGQGMSAAADGLDINWGRPTGSRSAHHVEFHVRALTPSPRIVLGYVRGRRRQNRLSVSGSPGVPVGAVPINSSQDAPLTSTGRDAEPGIGSALPSASPLDMAVATLSTIPPPDHATPDLDVSIVMPCLNEERTLPACIETAQAALDALRQRHGLRGEVVVADNGSHDASRSHAERLGARVVACPVRGYGAALRYGILASRGRFIVMGDADGSYDFRESVAMIERLMEGYDLCMGSRFLGTIKPGAMPWMNKYIGNPVLTGILNVLFHSGLSDAHCGMRAFTKSAFERLNPSSRGMEFASEMLIKATLLDQARTEVPVTLHPDGRGRPPHLRPFRDGWRHLRYLMMLSPVGLFLFPGAVLLATGVAVFAMLLSVPAGRVFGLGGLWIGDHWLPLGMAFISTGHLSLVFAMAATLLGIQNGYRHPTRTLRWLYWASKLEHMLFASAALGACGAVLLVDVAAAWAGRDFGQLGMQRQVSAAASSFMLAVQTFFGGFLLSIVAGNEADIEVALEEARRAVKRRLKATEVRR